MTVDNELRLKITVNSDATAGRPRPHRFLHCDWLQPRATSQKMNMFISGRSHITVITKYVNNALYTTSRDSTGVALAIGRVV